jgi:hypothetical protein
MLAKANFGEHVMPRYLFNVVQAGHVYRDDIGQEFANESAALEEALTGELVRDAAFASCSLDHVVEVSDTHGNVVITFRCFEPKVVAIPTHESGAGDDGHLDE